VLSTSLVPQLCTTLSVEHHFVVAQLQKSSLTTLLELRREFWGLAASFLILRDITTKSSIFYFSSF